MSDFRVVEIVNATTIKVSPKWTFPKSDGSPLISDLIKISGLVTDENNPQVIRRLKILLEGKEVEAFNPAITINQVAAIECCIYLAGTDVVYYFPELHPA